MFRIPFLVALTLGITFGVGILSTLEALKASVGFGSIAIGPWIAFPDAQTADADPYAQAHRARTGRLLYGTAEGLRFSAETDDAGQPLTGSCAYDIVGLTPPARFWTLFAGGPDDAALKPAPDRPFAFNSWSVLRQPDSSFVIHVGANARPGNWLAVDTRGPFRLVLTLLDTPTAGSTGVIDLAMPKIQRKGCGNAA